MNTESSVTHPSSPRPPPASHHFLQTEKLHPVGVPAFGLPMHAYGWQSSCKAFYSTNQQSWCNVSEQQHPLNSYTYRYIDRYISIYISIDRYMSLPLHAWKQAHRRRKRGQKSTTKPFSFSTPYATLVLRPVKRRYASMEGSRPVKLR